MAWNEPGGGGPRGNSGGNKDPWGSPDNNQGPPDLDEVLRNLQNKVRGLFGGGGDGDDGGRSGGGGPSISMGGIGGILLVVLIIWGLSGIYIVDDGKRGIVTMFGAYHATSEPGPHWHPRFIQAVETVNIDQIRNVEIGLRGDEALMLTQDENLVDAEFTVQYRVGDPHDYVFNVRNPDRALRQATESAIREIVGKSTLDMVITTGRAEIAQRAQELVQETLDHYESGLVVTSLNMQSAQAPEQVQDAFADAVKAREDQQRLINEAEVYVNEIIPQARGNAARQIEEANGAAQQRVAQAEGESDRFNALLAQYQNAPGVTRERLYIETMESVLGNVGKIMVDVEGSGNLMYLPLEQMMGAGAAGTTGSGNLLNPDSPQIPVNRDSSSGTTGDRARENARSREVR
ncbi:MAG: FtsH protease activity modulator HflK [Pseudomonadota bacterium]